MNKRLEQYVEMVDAGLKRLPTDEREKEITELRQHLEALMLAHEELGETTETATDSALKQLGDARVIHEELLKTHRRAKFYGLMNRPLSEFWPIDRRQLAAFCRSWPGAVVCTLFSVYSVYTFVPIVLALVYNPYNPSNTPAGLLWSSYAMLLLQCCLLGWLAARLSGRRCLPVLAAIVLWFNLYCIWPQVVHGQNSFEDWRLLLTVAGSTLVLPFLTAYATQSRSPSYQKV